MSDEATMTQDAAEVEKDVVDDGDNPDAANEAAEPEEEAQVAGPITLTDREKAEVFDQAAILGDKINVEEEAMVDLKSKFKVRKERSEMFGRQLRSLLYEAKHPAPLFVGAGDIDDDEGSDIEAENEAATGGPQDETWREVKIGDALAGIRPPKLIDKLIDAQITTVGELQAYYDSKGGTARLNDLPGIGDGGAAKIETALESFWERRRSTPIAPTIIDPAATNETFYATPIKKILGPGNWNGLLGDAGYVTIADLQREAAKDNLPYLEVIKKAGIDNVAADRIVKEILSYSERLNAPPAAKGGKA